MEKRKSSTLSFRKKTKSKKGDTDRENTEKKSSTNYAVVLAEVERLRNENALLKRENTRLRQTKEFKEVTDRKQRNEYVFPANHLAAVEKEVEQGAAEVQTDVEHSGMNNPENIHDRETKEEICKLQKTIESLVEHIKELTSSGQKYDINTITKDTGTWSDRETSVTVDSRCASLDQLNHLLEKHTQCTQKRLEMMEELLAKEMQQKPDTMEMPDEIVKIPPNIKAMAWKLQPYIMVTMEKVTHFGRHLGLEPDFVNRLAEENKHSPRDAFWSSICCWCKEHGDKASVDLLQQSCIEAKIDVLSRGLFPESHRLALDVTIPDLEEDLYPCSTLSYLRSEGVLDAGDVYYVASQKTRRERVTALVSLLPLFGETAFDVFLDALEVSGHQHLADALKNNLARGSSSSKYVTTTDYDDPSITTSFPSGQIITDELLFKTILVVLVSCKRTEATIHDVMAALENNSVVSGSLSGPQSSTSSKSDTVTNTGCGTTKQQCLTLI